jgi:2-C-methyl-D-erythritol 2,4-cyclodiphosphate synthase
MVHVGIGYDVHAFVEGRRLVLGGVEVPYGKGLDGHSDADVLMHAICDAILGALGEDDIGRFFPNTDPRWRNAPSSVFLEEAARQLARHEARLVNVDATLVAEEPKLAGYIAGMKANIARALNVNVGQVGIKATTNERLGFIGRGEGIVCLAVAGVDLRQEAGE